MVFAGGVSGGHLMPGAAVARELRSLLPDARVVFLTTGGRTERRCMPALAGFETLRVPATPWSGVRQKVLFPGRCVLAAEHLRSVLGELRPQVVAGLGGCNSFVPLLLGRLTGSRTILFEGNAIPGLVVRALAPVVDCLAVQFPEAAGSVKARSVLCAGNPVRPELFAPERREAARRLGLRPEDPVLLALGGSQGALSVNRILQDAVVGLSSPVQVLHLTGVDHLPDALQSPANQLETYRPVGFLHRMADAYAAADFVLCRAGASTVAEVTALGLPSILVPYPYHADRHQYANAERLERAGAAVVVEQSELTPDQLGRLIDELATDLQRRARMGEAARRRGRPGAARRVARHMVRMAGFETKLEKLPPRRRAAASEHSEAA